MTTGRPDDDLADLEGLGPDAKFLHDLCIEIMANDHPMMMQAAQRPGVQEFMESYVTSQLDDNPFMELLGESAYREAAHNMIRVMVIGMALGVASLMSPVTPESRANG